MRRPNGVLVLAILSFLGAGSALLGALAIFAETLAIPPLFVALIHVAGPGVKLALEIGSLLLAVPLLIATGIGLLRLRNWARILMIGLIGFSLLWDFFAFLGPHRPLWIQDILFNLIKGGIDVWILIYLFRPRVKQAFGATASNLLEN